MAVKHTHTQCQQAVEGVKSLLRQIGNIDDKETKKHLCDSAIEICNNLLREPPK